MKNNIKIPEIITPPNLQPRNKDEEKEEIIEGVIGIIIDDFGYRNDKVSDGFLKLNAKMTYAVIPGHSYSSLFGRKAVDAGYEVVVHMPLENTGKTFGEEEFVLLTSMKEDEMIKRLNKALDEIPTAIGMNNHQGSKASADSNVVASIAKVIKERNLFLLIAEQLLNQ